MFKSNSIQIVALYLTRIITFNGCNLLLLLIKMPTYSRTNKALLLWISIMKSASYSRDLHFRVSYDQYNRFHETLNALDGVKQAKLLRYCVDLITVKHRQLIKKTDAQCLTNIRKKTRASMVL